MSYGCRQITPTVPIDLDTVDGTLASLLIQQAGKDPGRSYLYGHFGRISYGETLTRVRQLAQYLASSAGIARRQSVAVSTETPEYLAYALWAATFADISIVLLPLCRDAQVMLPAIVRPEPRQADVHGPPPFGELAQALDEIEQV